MEFKLNKVDTDIRDRLQQDIKTDKIHANDKIRIKRELKKDDNKDDENKKNQKQNKKYIMIDSSKYIDEQFEVEIEKNQNINGSNCLGNILDTKK